MKNFFILFGVLLFCVTSCKKQRIKKDLEILAEANTWWFLSDHDKNQTIELKFTVSPNDYNSGVVSKLITTLTFPIDTTSESIEFNLLKRGLIELKEPDSTSTNGHTWRQYDYKIFKRGKIFVDRNYFFTLKSNTESLDYERLRRF